MGRRAQQSFRSRDGGEQAAKCRDRLRRRKCLVSQQHCSEGGTEYLVCNGQLWRLGRDFHAIVTISSKKAFTMEQHRDHRVSFRGDDYVISFVDMEAAA